MSNSMTEGGGRDLPPDRNGEIVRAPTTAAAELKAEILEASQHKDAGQHNAMRERSSIESRTDLRLAATNEASRSQELMFAAQRRADDDAKDLHAEQLRATAAAAFEKSLNDSTQRIINEAMGQIRGRQAIIDAALEEGKKVSDEDLGNIARADGIALNRVPRDSPQSPIVLKGMNSVVDRYPDYRLALQQVAPDAAKRLQTERAKIERGAEKSADMGTAARAAVEGAGPVARGPIDRWQVRADEGVPAEFKDVKNAAAAYDVIDASKMPSVVRIMRDGSTGVSAETVGIDGRREKSVGGSDEAFALAYQELQQLRQVERTEVATKTAAMRTDPVRPDATLSIEQETARRWADLDASDFGRVRSETRRENALEAIAGHMRASPEYSEELKKRSPVIADAARTLNDERAKQGREVGNTEDRKPAGATEEREAAERAAAELRKDNLSAAAQSRATLIDAAALAAVANVRAHQTARVVEQLARAPETTTKELRDAQQALKAPPLDGRVTAPNDPDIAAQRTRAIKRPVEEAELSQALLTRFVVSHEKRGLLDKGATEFTVRSGEQQGRVAFVDVGKSLTTEREDKSTIRAMVEVAASKNWKEITVSGADDFRRNAWIEASLNGMKVRGYEPREADKQILAELKTQQKPTNVITVADPEQKRATPAGPNATVSRDAAHLKHVDGDALTPHEKSVLDNSRAMLNTKELGEKFTDATLRELESKLRGERVYVGQIVDHGRAPYRFDKSNDDSYYVALKTRAGEQVIWGKGLSEAMKDRSPGEQIVLQNTGKRDVTVQERVRDDQGQVIDTRPKDAQRNAWTADLLSKYSDKARHDFESRIPDRQPALGVYDAKAPRPPARPDKSTPQPDQQRVTTQQRSSRER